jgi:hypothetical protein
MQTLAPHRGGCGDVVLSFAGPQRDYVEQIARR